MIRGYARVSSAGQQMYGTSLEAQEDALRAAGCSKVYREAKSGKSIDRPVWKRLERDLKAGDTLVVCKLDRIARSSREGFEAVKAMLDKGVAVRILNMGMVDDTPTGRLILNVMFSFAEFERDMIAERTQAGIAARKAADPDFKVGRKAIDIDESKLPYLVEQDIRYGKSAKWCAEQLGVSDRTYRRRRDEYLESQRRSA